MILSRMVLLRLYFEGGRYERYQRQVVLTGDSASLDFYGYDWSSLGVNRALSQTEYRLLVDGLEVARTTVAPGAMGGKFTVDLRLIKDGWHFFGIAGAPDETSPEMPMYVQRGAAPINREAMPVSLGTYGLHFESPGMHFIGTVPTRFTPRLMPLAERETPAFNTPLPRTELVATQLCPARPNDLFRPSVNAKGLMSTMNTQSYFWSDFIALKPRIPLLDGPRGLGTVSMVTHLQVGRRATYFCQPWRIGRINTDGQVITLVGHRHRNPPSFFGDATPDLELVGDWSAVPAQRRGFHELWGMAWDTRTLAVNEAAPPIPAQGNEKPHLQGPVLFVADTQYNRICRVEFSPNDHAVPAKVTEFITGLADPWDVVFDNGVLFVSERTAHRISAFDASSGARLRTVLQGADLSGVNSQRVVYRRTTLAAVRQQPVVGPEGLYIHDGWLYFASRAMEQVKRVHPAKGTVEWVCDITMDSNSSFAKIAVSDGTFGPKGTVFVAHWSVIYYGYPQAYLPGGKAWDYIAGYGERGTPYPFSGYPTAVAVGNGRMIVGSSSEGLPMMSRALPTDMPYDRDRYVAGSREYYSRGLQLLHGPAGWGYFGLPLPWGVSPSIDYYLETEGHRRA